MSRYCHHSHFTGKRSTEKSHYRVSRGAAHKILYLPWTPLKHNPTQLLGNCLFDTSLHRQVTHPMRTQTLLPLSLQATLHTQCLHWRKEGKKTWAHPELLFLPLISLTKSAWGQFLSCLISSHSTYPSKLK